MIIFLSLWSFVGYETVGFEPWDFNKPYHLETKAVEYHSSVTIVALWGIKFYQQFISPQYFHRCQFKPHCSKYGYMAVRKLGAIKGLIMATERILRCHPYAFLEDYPLVEDRESDPLGIFKILDPIKEGKKLYDPLEDNIIPGWLKIHKKKKAESKEASLQ